MRGETKLGDSPGALISFTPASCEGLRAAQICVDESSCLSEVLAFQTPYKYADDALITMSKAPSAESTQYTKLALSCASAFSVSAVSW